MTEHLQVCHWDLKLCRSKHRKSRPTGGRPPVSYNPIWRVLLQSLANHLHSFQPKQQTKKKIRLLPQYLSLQHSFSSLYRSYQDISLVYSIRAQAGTKVALVDWVPDLVCVKPDGDVDCWYNTILCRVDNYWGSNSRGRQGEARWECCAALSELKYNLSSVTLLKCINSTLEIRVGWHIVDFRYGAYSTLAIGLNHCEPFDRTENLLRSDHGILSQIIILFLSQFPVEILTRIAIIDARSYPPIVHTQICLYVILISRISKDNLLFSRGLVGGSPDGQSRVFCQAVAFRIGRPLIARFKCPEESRDA